MNKAEYDAHKWLYDLCLKHEIPLLTKYVLGRVYDAAFFEGVNDYKLRSANKVAAIICSHFEFNSIFDLGCGAALFLNEFHKLGKEVMGCDASLEGIRRAPASFTTFYADVTKPVRLNRKFDTVMCFEVAEHIKKRESEALVENCVTLGDRVFFTAAPVGQGGIGHINEQPREFWVQLFKRRGFRYDEAKSEKIRAEMKVHDVVFWIANNFMYLEADNL